MTKLLTQAVVLVCGTLITLGSAKAWAEEGLLWKVTSPYQASVVPPYTNQPCPFPVVEKEAQEAKDEQLALEILEMERAQKEKIAKARVFLQSSQALVPYLDGMAVGGMVDGLQGRKVLIGNQWVGRGAELTVRLAVSDEAKKKVAEVAAFDEPTAIQLKSETLNRLNQSPVTKLKLKDIRADALVLEGPYGEQILNFNIR